MVVLTHQDPELAMALRMSLEDEQQRQARLRESNE